MKRFLVTFIACLFVSVGFAQHVFKTEKSAHFKKESEKDTYKIVFPSPYGFMTLHHLDNVMMDNTKAMVLTQYDQSMKSIKSTTFNLPKLGLRASDLRDVIELENQLIFLSSVMHKKKGKHQINAQVYSEKDDTISENKLLASFSIDSYSKSGFYQIAISPDQTKIAVIANMPYVKKTKEKVKIWMYDNQLNLLWKQDETLNYKSERAYQESVFVDNYGVVFMNKTTNAFKKTRENDLVSFNGNEVITTNFSSPGFLPMEMKLIDVNGKSMFTGFFWNGKSTIIKINSTEGNQNDGAFLYDLTKNKLIGIHNWDNSLNSKDLKSLQIVDVIVTPNDIFLFGEKQITTSEFRKVDGNLTTDLDYIYTFGSSVIVNFNKEGTLKSFKPLFNSKKLINHDKEKGSFSTLFLEKGLRVFSNHNDHISFNTFFKDNEDTFNYPRVIPYDNGTSTIPFILPKTVKLVKNYGIVYYISRYRDRYWYNKMTW